MTVLLPGALAGLLLVGIPILLHLLRRREVREESFPALRYLLAGPNLQPRRLRMRERLLLLLRIGAVVLAVLAAARWVIPLPPGELPSADVLLVVDNGPLSGAVVEGAELLEAQKSLAREALAALSPRDRVWVIPTAGPTTRVGAEVGAGVGAGDFPDAPAAPRSPGEALEVVDALEARAHALPVEEARARGESILRFRPQGPRGVVVIRADGSRSEGGADAAPGVEVDPGIPLPENRGITRVLINDGLPPRAGEPFAVEVRVEASAPASPQGAADVPVRLVLNGVTVAGGRTDPEGQLRLPVPAQPAGSLTGWVEVDPDALRLDDRMALDLELLPPPAVEARGDPGRWVEAALATLRDGGRFARSGLPPLSGAAPLPEGAALLRSDHALLLVPPTDPVHLAAFNRLLEARGLPVRLAPPRSAGLTETDAYLPLEVGPSLPGAARGAEIRRHYPLVLAGAAGGEGMGASGMGSAADDPGAPGVRVLATLPGGAPWAVEVQGPTPTRVLASPLAPTWTSLPESAAMLPLVERLLLPGEGQDEALLLVRAPAHGLAPIGPPADGWTRDLVPSRQGREATPFLAWLLFVILCTEGWLAAASRARTRTDSETATPS